MARARDEVERRARRISIVWASLTGKPIRGVLCRPYAEMAFNCGEDRTMPPERDFLSCLRAKYAELKALGYEPRSIDSPAIWRMAQDLHHSEIKRQETLRRGDTVAMQLDRLSHQKEDRS